MPQAPETTKRKGLTLQEHLDTHTERGEGCWTWTGTLDRQGYGILHFGGKSHRAQRIAYEIERGPIPDKLVIDHLCRNPSCVRVEHLEAVDIRTNLLRGDLPRVSWAAQAAKTHCPQGHIYDLLNTKFTPDGRRSCRTCKTARQIKRRQK